MSLADLTFLLSKWENNCGEIIKIRKKVFMDGNDLPLNFLRHKDDAERFHIIAYDDLSGRALGTGCIHKDGHIGKIAVLHSQHKVTSIAHVIVDYLMHIAKTLKLDRVWLNAPIDTLSYYEYRDFYPIGQPFEFCGVTMQKIELWLEVEQKNKTNKFLKRQANALPKNVIPIK
jgi:hypothetical protein